MFYQLRTVTDCQSCVYGLRDSEPFPNISLMDFNCRSLKTDGWAIARNAVLLVISNEATGVSSLRWHAERPNRHISQNFNM